MESKPKTEYEQKKGFFAQCLKEFKFCAIATGSYILLSCLLCQLLGYGKSGDEIALIGGIPVWALFGVVIPWIAMVILTAIYGFKIMKGDDD